MEPLNRRKFLEVAGFASGTALGGGEDEILAARKSCASLGKSDQRLPARMLTSTRK